MPQVRYIAQLSAEEQDQLDRSALRQALCAGYAYLPASVKYYDQYHEGAYADRRLVVYDNGRPVLAFMGFGEGERLGYFHLPAEIFSAAENASQLNACSRALLSFLEQLCAQEGYRTLEFFFDAHFAANYYKRASLRTKHFCVVDLGLEEEHIRMNIRKSYKSLVNWGKNNLETRVMSKENADESRFLEFRDFHIRTAGRRTRSDASWMTQLEMIRSGEAFLVTAFLEGKLVSGNLVLHGLREAFYGVGVNDRELMAKNVAVSHYPLLHAVLHAKSAGLHTFNMNEIDPGGTDEKADSIAYFKQGFSNTLLARTVYTANLHD